MLGRRTLLALQWLLAKSTQRPLVMRRPLPTHIVLVLCWSLIWVGNKTAVSQPRRQPATNPIPTELETLLEKRHEKAKVTANTPSQQGFSVPSLWWTSQQFGEKLVVDWQAYGASQVGNQQINVIVRPDLWTRYTYYERYAFVLKFGSDASNFGYQLLVLDSQDFLLGAYTCDFAQSDPDFITDLVDSQSQPIPRYVDRASAKALPCRLWLSPNSPRNVL